MRYQTRLHKRDSTYYFRAKVPADLRLFFGDKAEIKFSLKTKDRRVAVQLIHQHSVQLDRKFERLRLQVGTSSGGMAPTVFTSLADEDIDRLCGLFTNEILENDATDRVNGLLYDDFDAHAEQKAETEKALRAALAQGQVEPIQSVIDFFCFQHGIRLDVDRESYRRFAYAFLQAATKVTEYQRRRNGGEVIETRQVAPPGQAFAPLDHSPKIDLDTLLDDWKKAIADRPAQTVRDYAKAVRDFQATIGRKTANEYERKDFIQYRDHLLQVEKLQTKTVEKRLGCLCTIFQLAVDNERIKINPSLRLKVPKPKVSPVSRLPFASPT